MSDLLFDTPWWLPVLIVCIGVFIFISGNRNQKAGVRNAGIGIVLLAMLIVLLTILVDTPKKIARRESQQLVQDAVSGNWTDFKSLLAPDVTLRLLGSSPVYANANELAHGAQAGTERVHLKEAHIRSMQVVDSAPLVTATLQILTEQDDAAAPMIDSVWQFDFEKVGGDWRIHEIRAMQIGQMSGDEAEQFLPKATK